jgi:hypothetical protein
MAEGRRCQLKAVIGKSGAFELTFSRPSALHCVVADAHAGSRHAATQLAIIRRIMGASSERRRCLLCDARIRGGLRGKRLGLFGFLYVPGDDPTEMLGHLICDDCVERHQSGTDLRTAIAAFYRARLETEGLEFPS